MMKLLIVFLSLLTNIAYAQESANFDGLSIVPKLTKSPLDLKRILSPKLTNQLVAIGLNANPGRSEIKIFESKIRELEASQVVTKGRGGVDTGGGTLIKTSDGYGLLDLYLYNKPAFLSKNIADENLQETNAFKKLGIEHVGNKRNLLLQKVKKHLQKWQKKSPLVVDQLLLALQNLPFYYIKGSLQSNPMEYFIPDEADISTSQLKLIALFRDQYGVQFGYDDLKALPEKHQIALVIHEGLRLVNFTGNLYLTNEKIQKLTSELIDSPNERETVDRPEYLNGDSILHTLKKVLLIYKSKYLLEDLCAKGYQPASFFCEFPTEKVDMKIIVDRLWKSFTELYANQGSNPSAEMREDMSQLYILIIKGENMQMQHILDVASYSGKYLEVRTKFIPLDLLIDKNNNE